MRVIPAILVILACVQGSSLSPPEKPSNAGASRRDIAAFQDGGMKKGLLGKVSPQTWLLGILTAVAVGIAYSPPGMFQQFHTVGEIPPGAFKEHRVLSATVVKVADGDTLRMRHMPTLALIGRGNSGRLSDETLMVRLYGVDAPELGKRGKPGQPFSDAAREYVNMHVLNKKVRLKLLRKDQYSRAVGSVQYGSWFMRRDLSEDLLREGLAVVYRQGGAEYDGKLDKLEELEAQAKRKKKGIWSQAKAQETPAQFKARMRKEQAEKDMLSVNPVPGAT